MFINFRGELRDNFVSHLEKAFKSNGIHIFKDDDALKAAEKINTELSKAIKTSKVHLVLLSKTYAHSSWCLDELAEIFECSKKDAGHMVVPVFYKVDPSDVRRQKGSFGEPFEKHKSRHPGSKLQKWKEALTQVANLSGFVTGNYRDEAKLIDDVTKEVGKMLSVSYLPLPTYAVGVRSRLHRMNELMCFGSDDVQVIGISGMGGIGKTTLAKAAFNKFSDRFEGTSFLENFGDCCKKPEGKVHLQRKLLSDISRRDDILFNMEDAMEKRFRNKRVLVVIDDLEDLTQLNSVAIDLSCFGPGSRIIVTSRNTHLLWQLGAKNIYSPKELDYGESLELLSWHAFRASEPPEAFLQLSEKLVEYCGGLPLAMEVLGASLFKRSISEWETTLQRLKNIPEDNIQAKLKISFDGLSQVQKDIFLDLSCFFIGMEKDYVSCILDGCKLYPEIGLSVLKERCLITVRDNKIVMHNLLRDMGRDISRNKCGKWSRLWDPDDARYVLANDYVNGTGATKGLTLKVEDPATEILEVKAFSKLPGLKLLQLSNVSLSGSYAHFPKDLRWLYWLGCPWDSVPINLHLRNLVVMDMQYSNLKRLWDNQEQPQFLEHLKHINLSHSVHLTETPNFSYLPNLEKLVLVNCKSLVLVHKSIGTLHKKLVHLNLKGCTELGDLPSELYTLKALETLILSGCTKLERLDDALGAMESLRVLKADYTALSLFPSSGDQLKNLEELSLDGCKGLWKGKSPLAAVSLPFSFNRLGCLKTLSLGFCGLSDELVPVNLRSMSCLEELDLRGNNFRNLKTDFAGLLSLLVLKLDSCFELQSMFSLPKTLRSFYANDCIMLERTPDLSECVALQALYLTNCLSLVETPGLDKLKRVGVIHMEMCKRIPHTYIERIMQGWAVNANGGIFIPGCSLPDWVSFKNETNSISFTVPETRELDPVGFTVWTPYMSQQNNQMSEYSPKITLKNQTKGTVWSRKPATDQIRMYHERHIWQGHFLNEDFNLETGGQIEVAVDFGDQLTILGTGLRLAYNGHDQSVARVSHEKKSKFHLRSRL